ncbi:MAG: FecR domain-containing protein, partial [Rhizobiales bacterium]|nr:FecR domain-containing protein [Hyphomicrobiales bacterium]
MLKLFASIVLLLVGASPALAASGSGTALGVDQSARLQDKQGAKTLVVGSDVFIGDRVVTDAKGLVQIRFSDRTKLVVGPRSSLVIEDYLLRDDGSGGKFAINALSGTFRFITGGAPKDRYQITTPTGTIGVRGTAFDLNVHPDHFSLLLFHGNGETIHDFARIQVFLFKHHLSSMSFDYSGFGASTGKATVRNLNQDAKAAWRAFAQWAGNQRPKFVLGYSLGTGVALHNVSAFMPQPLGVIVYGAFSSAKNMVSYISPGLPAWLKPIMPDLWDNVEAAASLREPLLVVAGMDDTNVPPSMGR